MLPVQAGLSRCIYDGKNLEKLRDNELQKKAQNQPEVPKEQEKPRRTEETQDIGGGL